MRNLNAANHDASIARTVITLGHSLGLRVIAEGVETEYQLALLKEWGCDEAQGYIVSRPAPAESLAPFAEVGRTFP